MKKVKILLTAALFVLLSLCLFTACKEATISSISVKSAPTKVVYQVNEAFSTNGLVVKASMSDGSEKDLSADEYTIDSSAFDKTKKGTYEIKIILNDDETKTCSYNVTVKEMTGFSAKVGYDNKFLQEEYVDLSNSNLVIIEEYSDGSTEEVSGVDFSKKYYCLEMPTTEVGEGFTTTIYSMYNDFTCEIVYDVLEKEGLTVKELFVSEPEVKEFTLENRDFALGQDIYFQCMYQEIPNRKYCVDELDVDYDYSAIENAETAGKYNAVFTYEGVTATIEFTLYDASGYELYSVVVDTTKFSTIYFKGETVEEYELADVPLIATYKKAGAEDIVVDYVSYSINAKDIEGITDTLGKKTVYLTDDGEDLCSYEIEVKELVVEDGTYLMADAEYGAEYGYEDEFKKNGDKYLFYGYNFSTYEYEYKEGYELVGIYRYVDDYNVTHVYMYFENDQESSWEIYFNANGELDEGYVKLDDNVFNITFHLGGETKTLYAVNGLIPTAWANELSGYGDARLNSKDGVIIENLEEYVFTRDTDVYLIYQQDATGASFLGTYEGDGMFLVVAADGVRAYENKEDIGVKEPADIYEYRYKIDGDTVNFTLQGGIKGTLTISTGVMRIYNEEYTRIEG